MPRSVPAQSSSRYVNDHAKLTKPPTLFIQEGATIRLPSDRLAVLVKWRIRAVDPENLAAGVERIAIVRTRSGAEIECSETYMRRAVVL